MDTGSEFKDVGATPSGEVVNGLPVELSAAEGTEL